VRRTEPRKTRRRVGCRRIEPTAAPASTNAILFLGTARLRENLPYSVPGLDHRAPRSSPVTRCSTSQRSPPNFFRDVAINPLPLLHCLSASTADQFQYLSCPVTSSAWWVSSAMSRRGLHDIAIAIMTALSHAADILLRCPYPPPRYPEFAPARHASTPLSSPVCASMPCASVSSPRSVADGEDRVEC